VTVSLHINKPFYQRDCVLCEVWTQETKPDTVIGDYETNALLLQLSCNLAISSRRGKGRVDHAKKAREEVELRLHVLQPRR
jgi:hypothetical protein